ncbi:oligosaccaryltransferase, partial [Colletotrichum nymphaeae SA-01]
RGQQLQWSSCPFGHPLPSPSQAPCAPRQQVQTAHLDEQLQTLPLILGSKTLTKSSRRSSLHITQKHRRANDPEPIMISDNDLYRLAIFLGSAAMVLIIFYHYVEVNTEEEKPEKATRPAKSVKAVS